jgi:hypothetical protein
MGDRLPLRAAAAAAVEGLEGRLCFAAVSFTAAPIVPVGNGPSDVVAADFDGDGLADFATSNFFSQNVSVRLSRGDGGFTPRPDVPLGSVGDAIATGDFDGNGIADLAVLRPDADSVRVLLGVGDGTFTVGPDVTVGNYPSGVAIGDLNGDGLADLVTTNQFGNDISVALGDGTGNFAPATAFPAGSGPDAVAIDDFDRDGSPDLVVSAFSGGQAKILRGAGDGTFGPPEGVDVDGAPTNHVLVADFNRDGRPDFATINATFNPNGTVAGSNVSVRLGNGDGTFTATPVLPAGRFPGPIAVGDFNGDARPDLVTGSPGDGVVVVRLGAGDGTFVTAATFATGDPSAIAVGDFNRDGRPDVVTTVPDVDPGLGVDVPAADVRLNTTPAFAVDDVTIDEGAEGLTTAAFTVRRQFNTSGSAAVDYFTTNGTATAGVDYQPVSGTLAFGNGQLFRTVVVQVNGDAIDEADETFFLNLDGALDAGFTRMKATATITDDDLAATPTPTPTPTPTATISINDIQRNEGNSGQTDFTFTVSRTTGIGTAKFDYVTANGSSQANDLAQQMGSITFGEGVTTVPLTIKVNGDTQAENDNTFFVNLSNAVNATFGKVQGVGVIKNDDGVVVSPPPPAPKATISVSDVQQNEGNAGQTNFSFIVSRTSGTGTASVKYATAFGTNADAADFAAQSGTVNFLNGETSKLVTIKVNGDTQVETDNTFFVNLSSPVNATIGDGQGLGVIKNDDPTSSPQAPTISINDVKRNEGNSGKTAFTFTVTRSSSAGSTSVKYATAFGSNTSASDMAQQSGLVTFAVGQMSKSITILVNGDTLAETVNTFFVNLSSPVNGSLLDAQGVGTILNDD